MTVDTIFDLASLTKPIATAVMQLVEEGKLSLDVDLSEPWSGYDTALRLLAAEQQRLSSRR